MECSLFNFNLLEDQIIRVRLEICQTWSCPLLVLFRVILPQTRHILCHFLQHFRLEVTGLT